MTVLADGFPLTVLHLGDRPLRTRMIAEMLRSVGATVVSCSGVEAALDAAEQQAFDVIFLDIQSTSFDAAAASQRLRAGPKAGRQAPIIAIFAGDGPARVRGFDGAVGWPTSLHELMRTTLMALEGRG